MYNAAVDNIDLQVLLVYYDSALSLPVFGSLTSQLNSLRTTDFSGFLLSD